MKGNLYRRTTLTWPPQNAAEMLALQQKYGRDADIAAALGVARYTVGKWRQRYRLPTVTSGSGRLAMAGKKLSEEAIVEMFAGRRYR